MLRFRTILSAILENTSDAETSGQLVPGSSWIDPDVIYTGTQYVRQLLVRLPNWLHYITFAYTNGKLLALDNGTHIDLVDEHPQEFPGAKHHDTAMDYRGSGMEADALLGRSGWYFDVQKVRTNHKQIAADNNLDEHPRRGYAQLPSKFINELFEGVDLTYVVAFWNDTSAAYTNLADCLEQLQPYIPQQEAEIYVSTPLLNTITWDAALRATQPQTVNPAAAQRVKMQKELHLMSPGAKKRAMEELGLATTAKPRPWRDAMLKHGLTAPGHKLWALHSEAANIPKCSAISGNNGFHFEVDKSGKYYGYDAIGNSHAGLSRDDVFRLALSQGLMVVWENGKKYGRTT